MSKTVWLTLKENDDGSKTPLCIFSTQKKAVQFADEYCFHHRNVWCCVRGYDLNSKEYIMEKE